MGRLRNPILIVVIACATGALGYACLFSGDWTDRSAPIGGVQPGTAYLEQDGFLLGVNIPWYNWACDFGCNENGGVTATRPALEPRIAEARAAGMRTLRWWLFPGDPWQIERDEAGSPTGINPAVYADIDAALDLAAANGMTVTFVIFSAPAALPQAWLHDPSQRDALGDVLGTLFARYRESRQVFAWEVINEPEWDIWEGRANESEVVALVTKVANEVHAQNPAALVTVGQAMLDGIPMWKGAGLDFYAPHWYDYMDKGEWCARCTDAATIRQRYGIDAPLVLGEMYAGPDVDALQRFTDFRDKGFAGAWAWSLFPEKTADELAVDLDAAARFAAGVTEATRAPSSEMK